MAKILVEWQGLKHTTGLLQINEDYARIANVIDSIDLVACLASTSAGKTEVSLGRRRDDQLVDAIVGLAWIYEQATGRRATRTVSVEKSSAKGGQETGAFYASVGVALAPLWPKAGNGASTVRVALLWSRKHPFLPAFYSIGKAVFGPT